MAVVFLFNLMCAIVSCDPYYPPPTPRPSIMEENTFMKEYRAARSFDIDTGPGNLTNFERPLPFVDLNAGKLEGYFMKVLNGREIYAFEGVPYAEPPIGNKRFRAPVPKLPWNGIRQAKKPGHFCTQMHVAKLNRVVGHEDCLTVNVYSPMLPIGNYNPNMSVMIFLHGGSWIFGAGSEYGPSYLLTHNLILVTVNFRLGTLGFLSTGDEENPGNWGLKDQALALEWVRNNIEKFGGNNKNITLAGQSAGATSVHLHMMSNLSKHLFQRAISMSGSALVNWAVFTPHQARKWSEKLARFMRCPTNQGTKAMMNCFRKKDPNFLTSNMYNLYDVIGFPPVLFRPVIEPDVPGAFITISPKEAYETNQVARIPFIASNTNEEAEFIRIFLTGFGFLKLWLRHWEVLAPTLLDYHRITQNTSAVTNAIADFYFQGQDIAKLSGREISKVGTDRYFYTGNRKTLSLHSTIAPTYSYIFKYPAPNGYAKLFGLDINSYGVSHAEDLSFIFNSTGYWDSFNSTDHGMAVSKLVVSLFANFVMKGEPLFTDQDGVDHRIWDPVKDPDNPMFLQIDEEVKMIPDPSKREMAFWDTLHLNDEFPYEFA